MLKAALSVLVLLSGLASQAEAQQWGASSTPIVVPPRTEASADPRRAAPREQYRSSTDAVITEAHIARLRSILRLSPAQQSYWAPVEVALSELARQQARGEAAAFNYKFTDRPSAIALTTMHLRRLKAIATPLIGSLDETQKRDAIAFGRHVGLLQLVAAF